MHPRSRKSALRFVSRTRRSASGRHGSGRADGRSRGAQGAAGRRPQVPFERGEGEEGRPLARRDLGWGLAEREEAREACEEGAAGAGVGQGGEERRAGVDRVVDQEEAPAAEEARGAAPGCGSGPARRRRRSAAIA